MGRAKKNYVPTYCPPSSHLKTWQHFNICEITNIYFKFTGEYRSEECNLFHVFPCKIYIVKKYSLLLNVVIWGVYKNVSVFYSYIQYLMIVHHLNKYSLMSLYMWSPNLKLGKNPLTKVFSRTSCIVIILVCSSLIVRTILK